MSRLERTQTPGRENSESLGVSMTSDSGGGLSGDGRRDKGARSARIYTYILSRESHPAQRGGYREKSLTETAAVATHCVFLPRRSEGSRSGISKARSIGQLSVCI